MSLVRISNKSNFTAQISTNQQVDSILEFHKSIESQINYQRSRKRS